MALLASKTAIVAIIVAIFALQWALATFAVYLLLKDKGVKSGIVFWNIFIMLGIIVGPVTYFISRKLKKDNKMETN